MSRYITEREWYSNTYEAPDDGYRPIRERRGEDHNDHRCAKCDSRRCYGECEKEVPNVGP